MAVSDRHERLDALATRFAVGRHGRGEIASIRSTQDWLRMAGSWTRTARRKHGLAGRTVPAYDIAMPDRTSLADRPRIATERLRLRRPVAADGDAIVAIVGDWDVARRLSRVPHPYGPADAAFFLEQVVPHEWVWAITPAGADEAIGMVGLTPDDDTPTAELGYWLSPRHWGRGLATEAARAVAAYGFYTLGLRWLTSGWFEDNPASGRVLEKLGFVETGRDTRFCLAAQAEVLAVRMRLQRPAR